MKHYCSYSDMSSDKSIYTYKYIYIYISTRFTYIYSCVRVVKPRTNICTLEKFDIFSDGKRKQGQLLIRQIKCSVKCVSYLSWGILCITHFTEFPEKYFLKMK